MNTINISQNFFSPIFWKRIFQNQEFWQKDKNYLFQKLDDLNSLIVKAEYNTGSICPLTAWILYCLIRFYKPQKVLEIGTFIGKSTLSIAIAMDNTGINNGEIHTCDISNSIDLPHDTKCKIIQYKKTSSTQMFQSLRDKSLNFFSFVYIDGRLSEDDIELLSLLTVKNTIIVLDDFEGYEKGVANYILLKKIEQFKSFLVYPPSIDIVKNLNFLSHSTTAVMIPSETIKLSNQ